MNKKDLNSYSLENGKYLYKGEYYSFSLAGSELRRVKRVRAGISVMEILAFIMMGVFDNGQGRVAYVALPMVACALPAFMGAAAAYTALGADEKMTVFQYKRGPARTRWCSVTALITGLMTLAGALVNGFNRQITVSDWPFIASAALFALCGLADTRLYARCPAKRNI